ncbi:Predicted N-formylglutamate amidohydrolase [Pseudorhodobacter antarcticus]|jgi:predicted N-formylglutamate amidohydrolase|uniref:Predicted N-formylglutamate amidohydrolase n=2 Tax=Pseudorhodobacter antarcticus TaxID=1077947 RepID=A0A1H8ML87_9RHOB|nr:N-formylglutamate amidohydrolase [Pseudorhodobacter antarcticus]SEO18054.1 Predicted N-formylglutamate amidohydrolase [Pseudorhodobacter antarcticus]
MNHVRHASSDDHVIVENARGQSCIVIVCEHASSYIPEVYKNLGMRVADLLSHAAWDPGALDVARGISFRLDARLVASGVSRLVYDCNRPPSAMDAMPAQSETIKIPGNADLTADQRRERSDLYYTPFRDHLAKTISATAQPVVVTVHSFTPIYNGEARSVEIGILHDTDRRFADTMLALAHVHTLADVQRNAPYGPEHGVTHTLKEHAINAGHLNVMIEIRNDLIQTADQQNKMADTLSTWLSETLQKVTSAKDTQ